MMNNRDLIITRTPLRISFFGGGTDIPYFFKKEFGQTLSVAINKYVYVIIKTHNNYDEKYRINYSKTENVNFLNDMKNKRVKSILNYFKIKNPLYISTISDIPANTGLGSSSAFTVGLIRAVLILKNKKMSKEAIANLAFKIEHSLKEDLGKQDQYISSLGGIKHFIYRKNSTVKLNTLKINNKIQKLLKNSLLIYTGQKRLSKNILKKQKKNFKKNYHNLVQLKKNVNKFINLLKKNNNLESIGNLFDNSWKLKIKLSDKISNTKINKLYKSLISDGCYGGKLLGAGNGGFIFMVMNYKTKKKILNKFKKYKIFQPQIDYNGSIVLKK